MDKNNFSTIGIGGKWDWKRIQKLLLIGLLASVAHLIADMLLGWGIQDETLSGIRRMFSAYGQLGNGAIYTSAVIGMLSIILEALSYFGVYRLMAVQSPKHAHSYRSGIFGYMMFCPFAFHVAVCVMVYLGRNGADDLVDGIIWHFFIPGFILFWVFFAVLVGTQMSAFIKGKTPYPKWTWIFSVLTGMLIAKVVNVFGNVPVVNAIDCAWIAIGNIWMFSGLLFLMKKAALKCRFLCEGQEGENDNYER